MKVLVVLGTDAENLHIVNICKELLKRRHTLIVYSVFNSENTDYMFYPLNIDIISINRLSNAIAKKMDVALCGDTGMNHLKYFDIYTFVYTAAIDERMAFCADFLFNFSGQRRAHYFMNCPALAIGNTKITENLLNEKEKNKKQILYIDSGHMPFGRKGKAQIAELLIKICYENPEYEIVIKPRWLREMSSGYTHKNIDHIYDFIENACGNHIPSNLKMLEKHVDMYELIRESQVVLTLYTSAILDVLICKKNLVIITGYDCEDKRDFRKGDEARKQEFWGRTGCTVDINHVVGYLPHGIQSDGKFLAEVLPEITGASVRAADVMEFVYEKFLSNNQYPEIEEYDYRDFRETMRPGDLSWKELKQNRFQNIERHILAAYIDKTCSKIDFSECYTNMLEIYQKYPMTPEGFEEFQYQCTRKRNEVLVKNKKCLMGNAIDQAILLQALYDLGLEQEILDIPREKILCHGPYHYYLGCIDSKKGLEETALDHFYRFLEDANSRNYDKYPQECAWGFRNAYQYVFRMFDGSNLEPQQVVELFIRLHEKANDRFVDFWIAQKNPRMASKISGEYAAE